VITIRHTPAEGTLISGSRKGDGVWEVLKAQPYNWKYSRNVGLYLGQSRDKAAQKWKIDAAAEALKVAGHDVTVEIDDDDARSFAEAEQERYDRAEERADRFSGYADGAAARSGAAYAAVHQIAGMIPMGQPVLVGHHSERRHRRDLDRIDRGMRRSIEEDRKAGDWSERAEAAGQYQARRESVPTTLRRIEGLEADRRLWQRALDGEPGSRTPRHRETDGYMPAQGTYLERVQTEIGRIDEQLTYWRAHVKRMEAEQGVKVWSAADFTKGDFVRFLGTWYEVLRVNAKSVTIPAMISGGPVVTKANSQMSWTDTVPYHKVKARKSAEEIAALLTAS
jgi:Domain of unknown function (DUF3560)